VITFCILAEVPWNRNTNQKSDHNDKIRQNRVLRVWWWFWNGFLNRLGAAHKKPMHSIGRPSGVELLMREGTMKANKRLSSMKRQQLCNVWLFDGTIMGLLARDGMFLLALVLTALLALFWTFLCLYWAEFVAVVSLRGPNKIGCSMMQQ